MTHIVKNRVDEHGRKVYIMSNQDEFHFTQVGKDLTTEELVDQLRQGAISFHDLVKYYIFHGGGWDLINGLDELPNDLVGKYSHDTYLAMLRLVQQYNEEV